MLASRSSFLLVRSLEVDWLAVLASENGREEPQFVAGKGGNWEYGLVAEEFVEEVLKVGDAGCLPTPAAVPPFK